MENTTVNITVSIMEMIMKNRTYGIILGILNIVLLVISGVFFLGKDKNAPEIFLPGSSLVYAEEAGTETLFRGVTAFDEEDGELTDEVVIEKIVPDRDKATATITYGVADSAGNVGKVTCTVEMLVEEAEGIVEEGTVSEEGSEESEVLEEDASEENNAESEETESEEEDAEFEDEESEEEDDDVNSEDGESEEDDDVDSEDRESEETESEEEEESEDDAAEEDTVQTVSSNPNPGRPSIAFRSQEIKTKAGQSPAWVNVIEGLHDDIDNYESLLKTLKVKGDYDKDKAGTYSVTVTVTDGDGNESNAYPMKIVVEAWE